MKMTCRAAATGLRQRYGTFMGNIHDCEPSLV